MDLLRAMRIFVRVAESGSFSRAAESLDVANATVTGSVRSLERYLSITLINRDTRYLQLTQEGEIYLKAAQDILQRLESTEEELQALVGDLSGPLYVETTISLGRSLLCPALIEFTRLYPDIATMVTLINQPQNMIERATDVALRLGQVDNASLVARPLFETAYVLCAAPDLAPSIPEHPRDLDPRMCIGHLTGDRRSIMPWNLLNGSEEVDIHPQGNLHFNSSDHAVSIALSGMGVVCVLEILVEQYLLDGSLVRVCPDWTTQPKMGYLVTPKSRTGSARVKAFSEFMLDAFARHRTAHPHRLVDVRTAGRR